MASRLLYITVVDIFDSKSGIANKCVQQVNSARRLGWEVDILVVYYMHSVLYTQNGDKRRFYSLRYPGVLFCIYVGLISVGYSKVWLRSWHWMLPLWPFIISKNKFIVELPHFPYKEEYTLTLVNKLRLWIDHKGLMALRGFKFIGYSVDHPVGVSYRQLSNCVARQDLLFDTSKKPYHGGGDVMIVKIVYVASFQAWHNLYGLTKAILLHKEKVSGLFQFEIIGDGVGYAEAKQLVIENDLPVKFYGRIKREEALRVMSMADIGLDSLARNGFNDSIKSKEYWSQGLVVLRNNGFYAPSEQIALIEGTYEESGYWEFLYQTYKDISLSRQEIVQQVEEKFIWEEEIKKILS